MASSFGVAGAHTLTLGGSSANTANLIYGTINDGSGTLGITVNPSNPAAVWSIVVPRGLQSNFTGPVVVQSGTLVATIERGPFSPNDVGFFPLGTADAGTSVARGATLRGDGYRFEPLTLDGTGVDSKGALQGGNPFGPIFVNLTTGDTSIGSGGTINGNVTMSGGGGVNRLLFTADDADTSQVLTVTGDVIGTAPVVKVVGKRSTLAFNGTNKTYAGPTIIDAGFFSLSTGLPNTAGLTIGPDGTFGGDRGTVNTAVTTTINGSLSPGNMVTQGRTFGTLTVGNLVFAPTSVYQCDVYDDEVIVHGNLTLDPSNSTVLQVLSDNLMAVGTTNTVIDYDGTWNGGLFTVNGVVVPDGGTFMAADGYGSVFLIDYNAGGANGSVTLTKLVGVPEPAAGLLLAAAGTGLVARRRRRTLR